MWPTRSRTSHSVQRVWTFQLSGLSRTRWSNFWMSRRRTAITVSLASAAIGLTGRIGVIVLMGFLLVSVCWRQFGDRWDDDRGQVELEVLAVALRLRRQLEAAAQGLRRLVDGEAGPVGGDLEEHAARLPEVDRNVEVDVLLHVPCDAGHVVNTRQVLT